MRHDTPFGPVWILPDIVGETVAKKTAQVDLMWGSEAGFVAMHTGPTTGGAFLVRAPKAALEAAKFQTDSASEHPVKKGTVWPPIHVEAKLTAPETPFEVENAD